MIVEFPGCFKTSLQTGHESPSPAASTALPVPTPPPTGSPLDLPKASPELAHTVRQRAARPIPQSLLALAATPYYSSKNAWSKNYIFSGWSYIFRYNISRKSCYYYGYYYGNNEVPPNKSPS